MDDDNRLRRSLHTQIGYEQRPRLSPLSTFYHRFTILSVELRFYEVHGPLTTQVRSASIEPARQTDPAHLDRPSSEI